MTPGKAITFLFSVYNLVWTCVLPFLKRQPRIADGFEQRMGNDLPKGPVDIWFQSASAGESYLTGEILKCFDPARALSIWLTTNTRQGLDILMAEMEKLKKTHPDLHIHVSFAPFDCPSLMNRVVRTVRPGLMVLVELEVWPGLLKALKDNHCQTLVVNGRLTEKSLKRYLMIPSLWSYLSPDTICTISKDDARRFERMFPSSRVHVIPNIKFDRITFPPLGQPENPLRPLFDGERPLVVLGSVRQEEEAQVEQMIHQLVHGQEEVCVLLFPRHMHRVPFWVERLKNSGLVFKKRSEMTDMDNSCRVVIWDLFGELGHAYALAQAAFVGGSLAPLGGQNFLEALSCGIVPVSGPSWGNFTWVGQAVVDKGLLLIEPDGESVARRLLSQIHDHESKETVKKKALAFLEPLKGGTRLTCEHIDTLINPHSIQGQP